MDQKRGNIPGMRTPLATIAHAHNFSLNDLALNVYAQRNYQGLALFTFRLSYIEICVIDIARFVY